MVAKTFEVRDRMTFIPVLAVRLLPWEESDRYLLARSGYGLTPSEQGTRFIVIRLNEVIAVNDAQSWNFNGTRTMQCAHEYIEKNWDELKSGEVIDVEWVLGEKADRKRSESVDHPI